LKKDCPKTGITDKKPKESNDGGWYCEVQKKCPDPYKEVPNEVDNTWYCLKEIKPNCEDLDLTTVWINKDLNKWYCKDTEPKCGPNTTRIDLSPMDEYQKGQYYCRPTPECDTFYKIKILLEVVDKKEDEKEDEKEDKKEGEHHLDELNW
jgi:hypothetical protein